MPWIGFPLRRVLELARPFPNATHVRFESFASKGVMPGVAGSPSGLGSAPWPYVEAMTVPEARRRGGGALPRRSFACSNRLWRLLTPRVLCLAPAVQAWNDLSFLAVGLHNRTLPPQSGAPIRLHLPWKYG